MGTRVGFVYCTKEEYLKIIEAQKAEISATANSESSDTESSETIEKSNS